MSSRLVLFDIDCTLIDTGGAGKSAISAAAEVPIVPGYLDYSTKTGGFGPPYVPTGDMRKDMDVMRAFYADKVGLYPERWGPVRLKEETED